MHIISIHYIKIFFPCSYFSLIIISYFCQTFQFRFIPVIFLNDFFISSYSDVYLVLYGFIYKFFIIFRIYKIITVYKGNILSFCHFKTVISCFAESLIFLGNNYYVFIFMIFPESFRYFKRAVLSSVIYYYNFVFYFQSAQ